MSKVLNHLSTNKVSRHATTSSVWNLEKRLTDLVRRFKSAEDGKAELESSDDCKQVPSSLRGQPARQTWGGSYLSPKVRGPAEHVCSAKMVRVLVLPVVAC